MRKLLFALALCLLPTIAHAQNTTCSDRPQSDSSNACANTRFAHGAAAKFAPGGANGSVQYNNNGVFGGINPLDVPRGGTGQQTFTPNLPLIGNGTGAINQGTVSGNTTTFGTTSGALSSGNCAKFDANGNIVDSGGVCASGGAVSTYDTVAALNAATVPAGVNSVDTLGYYARGDGGGTTYVRVASAPALPCSQTSNAGASFWDLPSRSVTNVKWCGAKGDSTTDDSTAFANAVTSAYSVHGAVYVPGVSGYYLANISLQDKSGLSIEGDAKPNATIANTGGSEIVSPNNGITLNIFSNVGSGTCNNVNVSNLKLVTGGTSTALSITNCLWFRITSVIASGYSGTTLQGSGIFTISDLESYGAAGYGLLIGNGNNTLTNSGPGSIIGSQIQGNGGAMYIFGEPLNVSFYNTMYASAGGSTAIQIEGSGIGNPTGDLAFYNLHGESAYPSAPNAGADIVIGLVNKFGHVAFYGGQSWGQGDGTNYYAYWLEALKVNNLEVMGYTVSKLGGANGYNLGMVYLGASCGCNYRFINLNKDNIAGPLYVDARTGAPLSSWVLDATNRGPLDGYYTVANLPACSGSLLGYRSVVIDASSPTFNTAVTGGSSTRTAVMCNGTSWIAN